MRVCTVTTITCLPVDFLFPFSLSDSLSLPVSFFPFVSPRHHQQQKQQPQLQQLSKCMYVRGENRRSNIDFSSPYISSMLRRKFSMHSSTTVVICSRENLDIDVIVIIITRPSFTFSFRSNLSKLKVCFYLI